MEIIRRKEENFFGNITYSKKSFEMFTGEKMLVPKHIFIQTLFFHIGQKSYSKTEIVFKKKYWKECDDVYWNKFSVSQVFQKDQKNKTKKINRWSFFSSAKILQEFMWWYMIIIFQLFRLFSARLCYISLIYFCYCAYIENPDTIS